jgi:hypothetical protein
MPNGFREVKSSRCEAAVLPGSYSLRHRRQKGEKAKSLSRAVAGAGFPIFFDAGGFGVNSEQLMLNKRFRY